MNSRNHSKQKQRAGQDTELKAVLRKHKAEGLKVRRANAHLLLNKGHSASFVADALLLDSETVRRWRRGFEKYGMASLDLAEYPEREGHLTAAQEEEAKEHFRDHPPCDTREGAGVAARDLRDLLLASGIDQADALSRLRLEAAGAAAEACGPGGAKGFYCAV